MAGTAAEVVQQTTVAAGVNPSYLQDPVFQGLAWILGLVTLIFAIGKPIKDWLRTEKQADKAEQVEDAKANAESTLYAHLSEQVTQYRNIADQAFKERNALVERVARLEEKTNILDEAKTTLDRLKARLEDKDRRLEEKDAEIRTLLRQASEERAQFLTILQAKDAEIARRDDRILSLEERQRELENRLSRDEASIGLGTCPFQRQGGDMPAVIPVPEAGG